VIRDNAATERFEAHGLGAMIATLRKKQGFGRKQRRQRFADRPTSRNNSGEAPMMAERLDRRALVPHDRLLPDRRLRNRIIIGNVMAWVAIIILIDLLFF
jgi:hypothetical protein